MATYKPADAAVAALFARYKRAKDTIASLDEHVKHYAVEEMRAGASVADLTAVTGISDEVFRRLARLHGVERKRPPTVGKDAKPKTAD